MIIFYIICLSVLLFLLLFLLFKLKCVEGFYEDENDDIVPYEGDGFAAIQEKEIQRKKEITNSVGGANNWGGWPVSENENENNTLIENQLSNCQQQIDDQNINYNDYLKKIAEKDTMAALKRKFDEEKINIDFQDQLSIYTDQINDYTNKNKSIIPNISNESNLLNQCLEKEKPMNVALELKRECCNDQRNIVQDLSEKYDSCIKDTISLPQKIVDATNNFNNLQNELNNLKSINSSLENKYNQCQINK
jgi:predicted nuclease with TOPRIM domain